ncbi:hypothetical protein RJ639_043672 [Escallonia herrerae]|uniref:DUF4283 domain-containing protein n=1 Tax=Escallonia herrerae TaxID=1293975 RepID=A0AA89B307_9ASTE|nr:hypothetical protein RJ639_043672 [Escallonia herrerae]
MLIAAKSKSEIAQLKALLSAEFEMKDLGAAKKILSMEISRDRQSKKLWITQKKYIQKVLERFSMLESKRNEEVCTPMEFITVLFPLYTNFFAASARATTSLVSLVLMANLQQQLDLDKIIAKTNQLHREDFIELEKDDTNANNESSLVLLAKITSLKKQNNKAVQNILSNVWNPTKGMKIFAFNHEWDRSRILDSRPWSIMSSHMVVKDWPPNLTMKEIDFNLSPFWIRICGLPPNQMTKLNAEKIAEKIGTLQEIDFTTNGKISWFKFLRIRVEIDVSKPLHTSFNRNKDPHSKARINLQYERLPDFCFNYKKLGHVLRSCPNSPLNKPESSSSPYSPWKRAGCTDTVPLEVEWNSSIYTGEIFQSHSVHCIIPTKLPLLPSNNLNQKLA